ncbi:S1 family peptidase [Motiliproteus sediminis]|uniref:S1 family peptidase n=1 Tax=Motiliproteus sediminis TaxID=1468178 RepID=UPI001FE26BA2|nr:serine protease [Motiliproteus sediminis]
MSLLLLLTSNAVGAALPDTLLAIKPSIVAVATYQATRRPPVKLLGTGFVVSTGRLAATNAHVIPKAVNLEDRERLVVVAKVDGVDKMIASKVVAVDGEHDLALVAFDHQLPAVKLDQREYVREGELFAFTGFPIGGVLGLYPVTHRGLLSSITPMAIPVDQAKQLSPKKIKRLQDPVRVYQLDATAYPGNSGSPLYRIETGEVVGVLNQVYVKATKEDVLSQPSGISFAIPVRHLKELLESLER